MANERQASVVAEARSIAARLDEILNDVESLQARYDVLDIETPNFATGYFGSAQEITAAGLLGFFTSRSALKAAASAQWDAWRAAVRKIRG